MSTRTSSTIKLNLPSGILNNAQGEAKRIGISIQDFIRMLIANHFANNAPVRPSSREQMLYNQAMDDIRNGRYTSITTKKQLQEHLDSLS